MYESTHHEELNQDPVSDPRANFIVPVILLLLTGVTVGASFLNLHVFNAIIAIGISVIEAVLVTLYLMHVKSSSLLTKLTIIAGIFTFLVLIFMSLTDYIARAWGQW